MNLPDLAGICAEMKLRWAVLTPADVSTEFLRSRYSFWMDSGNSGALSYIDNRLNIICDPFGSRPWANSAIIITFTTPLVDASPLLELPRPAPGAPFATIAEYAIHEDYHITGQRILKSISEALGQHQSECCVDSSPVPEKEFVRLAGLGTSYTPNSLIRMNGFGCRVHIAVMFTSLPFHSVTRNDAKECGDCRRCKLACPNSALDKSGLLAVRSCRSWLAGEFREALSREQQIMLHNTIYGCSLCSSCCPDDGQPLRDLRVDPMAIMTMPTAHLKKIIATTPVAHTGATLLKRNCAAALLTQSPDDSSRQALAEKLLQLTSSPVVRDTILAWTK